MSDYKLWTASDLGAFLGLSAATVQAQASRSPERLPPRVRTLAMLRWDPDTCRAWAVASSEAPQRKRAGRPRLPV